MASISSLPIHLIADILRELDHVNDLPAVLLSSRACYSTFKDTPYLPIDILRRQVPSDLFPLAITALASHKSIRDPRGVKSTSF